MPSSHMKGIWRESKGTQNQDRNHIPWKKTYNADPVSILNHQIRTTRLLGTQKVLANFVLINSLIST